MSALRQDKVNRLRSIFENKGWEEITESKNREFDDFCQMLTYFDDTQQDLILSLTDDFLQIKSMSYVRHFFEAYKKLIVEINDRFDKILIQPLVAPKDIDKTKSSKFLFYFLKGEGRALKIASGEIDVKFIENHYSLEKEGVGSNTLLCLVDDYVGTGNTALEAVRFLLDRKIPAANICVVSLAAQSIGFRRLKEINIPLYYLFFRDKALSDNSKYTVEDIKTMERIEKRMGVSRKYLFGYGKTEGLIRLHRIPNNTFPVYWYTRGKIPVVPFPRQG
jgi:hypothetical protein